MTAATDSPSRTATVLCWCGADVALEAALEASAARDIAVTRTSSEFLEALHERLPAGVILGGKPASEAIRLLHTLGQEASDVPVYVALSEPTADDVRLFVRKGARDVLWIDEIETALAEKLVRAPAVPTPPAPPAEAEVEELVCLNERMRKVADIARRIAPTDSTVLIQGESGTGKELVAAMIHRLSRRLRHPFVTVNCGAIPEPLLESQLYGHEKGSFTGAIKQQKGLFEIADQGTIVLDEIGELGLEMQVKLLRFLQSREFRRVGGSGVNKVDVRVLAATNRELKEEVARGRFRMDLFYRLNVITLVVPPLRDRPEEIPALVEHFVEKICRERKTAPRRFAPETIGYLRKLTWPGNVRELENAVERLLLLAHGEEVTVDDLVEFLEIPAPGETAPAAAVDAPSGAAAEDGVWPTLADVERAHIARALEAFRWNKMRTARALAINVKTLYNKIRAYGLAPPPGMQENGVDDAGV
jgi:DNA-binding NtrC family response regulator